MIKKLIKMARGLLTTDTGNYRRVEITYMGVTKDALDITPYGFFHNTPSGGMALVFSQNGQESNSIAIVDDPKNRFANTKPGEVGLYNQLTKSHVYLKSDGSIELKVGDTTAILTEAALTLTGADIITDGNIIAAGNMTATGTVTGETDVVFAGISGNSHVHGGVDPGTSNTSGPS
jgi:phage baseplate assembly protein V